ALLDRRRLGVRLPTRSPPAPCFCRHRAARHRAHGGPPSRFCAARVPQVTAEKKSCMRILGLGLCLSFAAACSPDAPAPPVDPQVAAVTQYVALMRANSEDAVNKLEA